MQRNLDNFFDDKFLPCLTSLYELITVRDGGKRVFSPAQGAFGVEQVTIKMKAKFGSTGMAGQAAAFDYNMAAGVFADLVTRPPQRAPVRLGEVEPSKFWDKAHLCRMIVDKKHCGCALDPDTLQCVGGAGAGAGAARHPLWFVQLLPSAAAAAAAAVAAAAADAGL